MKPCELCCKIGWFFTYPLGAGGRVSHFSHGRSNVWFQAYQTWIVYLNQHIVNPLPPKMPNRKSDGRIFELFFRYIRRPPETCVFCVAYEKNIARGTYLFLTQVYFNN